MTRILTGAFTAVVFAALLVSIAILAGSIYGCGSGDRVARGIGDSARVAALDSGASGLTDGRSAGGVAQPRWKSLDTPLAFAGVWVNDAYVRQLTIDGSPSRHQDFDASCIQIPDSTLEATSMVGGFHDGGPTMVVVKDGSRYQFYNSELDHARDTIEPLADGRLRIGRDLFRRLAHPDTDRSDWGILEELLFDGTYEREDGKEVRFDSRGFVDGMDSILFYEPVIDYADMGYTTVDQIRLGRKDTKLYSYGFRWAGDTLMVYRLRCARVAKKGGACDSMGYGDLLWRLRKKGPPQA